MVRLIWLGLRQELVHPRMRSEAGRMEKLDCDQAKRRKQQAHPPQHLPDSRVRHYSAACGTSSPRRTPRTTYSAATLIASIMLTALALPVPAMSNAVP